MRENPAYLRQNRRDLPRQAQGNLRRSNHNVGATELTQGNDSFVMLFRLKIDASSVTFLQFGAT